MVGLVLSKSSNELLVAEAVEAQMVNAARNAHPDETGGLLLGVRVGRTFWITEAVEVTTGNRGATSFWLPEGVTSSIVDSARANDARLGYVGEWHVHPANVGPSPKDATTMRRLSLLMRRRAILMLVVRVDTDYQLRATSWSLRGCREFAIVRTGPLPPAEIPTAHVLPDTQ